MTGFLSTPSARRATFSPFGSTSNSAISIHALREEGDDLCGPVNSVRRISIHALREEGDFFSTRQTTSKGDFYPRPPRGGRLASCLIASFSFLFLSTPSARRATYFVDCFAGNTRFLSTPSARRATWGLSPSLQRIRISIHALREEGDVLVPVRYISFLNFYPRPPRGGRRDLYRFIADFGVFLSTPSARRATC